MFSSARQFAKAAAALALPYWVSGERWRAGGLLALIVALNFGLVYVNVLFSDWNNRFYNALQQHDFSRFLHELGYFCILAAVFIVIAVYQTYLTQMLEIRWRGWLTDQYLGDWLGKHAYYHLQLGEYGADNPDQRIADDLLLFVGSTLPLTLGLLSSVVTLVSFASILWRLLVANSQYEGIRLRGALLRALVVMVRFASCANSSSSPSTCWSPS